MKSMIEHWNNEAEKHDKKFIGDLGMAVFYDEIEKQIEKCHKKSNILVLGCGTGLEIERIKFKANVVAIDISEKMIKELKKKEFYDEISLNVICGSFLDVKFDSNTYDIVLSCLAMHHFEKEQKILIYKKVYDCLSGSGVFLNGDSMEKTWDDEINRFEKAKIVYEEKKLPFGSLHIDIPFCFEHELKILKTVGFKDIVLEKKWDIITLYRAIKS